MALPNSTEDKNRRGTHAILAQIDNSILRRYVPISPST